MTLLEKKSVRISDFKDFDVVDYLDTPERMADYLTACFQDENPDLILVALNDIARAKGMADVARRSGLGRESLYKALAPGAQPRFETIRKIIAALDLKVRITV